MQLVRRLRLPAILCALAVLICELTARPYANMSVCDDGPYILMARTLATTGRFVYNGWASPVIGWQLYLGAAFIKLFGFSFTTVRFSTVLVAMALTFVLQRTLVLAGITERNATLGTLALVLSPLYLMLSVTYMTDIFGLFAIVLCLYGCLHALQSPTQRSTLLWLLFAIATNALFGTARQIAWLGILILVPSTLWLLRANRRTLIIGTIANLAGILFMIACLLWLKRQPYVVPVPLLVRNFPVAEAVKQLALFLLEIPFLLLPITVSFVPAVRKASPRLAVAIIALLLSYCFLSTYPSHLRGAFRVFLEPTSLDWVTVSGIYSGGMMHGSPLIFLAFWARLIFTFLTFGGLVGFAIVSLRSRGALSAHCTCGRLTWHQLRILLGPFTLVYLMLIVAAVGTTHHLFDRYSLGLLIVLLLYMVRLYQERVQQSFSILTILLVVSTTIYGIAATHNNYSYYRARVALSNELANAGIPPTSVDNGWEYNIDVELQHAKYINDPRILVPANAYVPVAPPFTGVCSMYWYDRTPHIHPLYAVSFDPHACYGPAPFAPIHYSRWLASGPGTLYAVRYNPNSKP